MNQEDKKDLVFAIKIIAVALIAMAILFVYLLVNKDYGYLYALLGVFILFMGVVVGNFLTIYQERRNVPPKDPETKQTTKSQGPASE